MPSATPRNEHDRVLLWRKTKKLAGGRELPDPHAARYCALGGALGAVSAHLLAKWLRITWCNQCIHATLLFNGPSPLAILHNGEQGLSPAGPGDLDSHVQT